MYFTVIQYLHNLDIDFKSNQWLLFLLQHSNVLIIVLISNQVSLLSYKSFITFLTATIIREITFHFNDQVILFMQVHYFLHHRRSMMEIKLCLSTHLSIRNTVSSSPIGKNIHSEGFPLLDECHWLYQFESFWRIMSWIVFR